jgi:anti-sigma regulatory factor (Ser/Thr protein kinase)
MAIADIGITEIAISAMGVAMITKMNPPTEVKMNEDMTVELARAAGAGADARNHLATGFGHAISGETMDELLLVVTELVNNAYLHGEGSITLKVGLDSEHVRVEVIDEGTGKAPAIREEPTPGSGGLGLRIVDRVASRWGAFEGTTHVYADIPLR